MNGERAAEIFVENFVRIMRTDKDLPEEDRAMIVALLTDWLDVEEVRDNFNLAMSGLLWHWRELHETDTTSELAVISNMIDKVADPSNENTQKIKHMFESIIDEAIEPIEDLTEQEINEVEDDS